MHLLLAGQLVLQTCVHQRGEEEAAGIPAMLPRRPSAPPLPTPLLPALLPSPPPLPFSGPALLFHSVSAETLGGAHSLRHRQASAPPARPGEHVTSPCQPLHLPTHVPLAWLMQAPGPTPGPPLKSSEKVSLRFKH